jgi:hypothetical protein
VGHLCAVCENGLVIIMNVVLRGVSWGAVGWGVFPLAIVWCDRQAVKSLKISDYFMYQPMTCALSLIVCLLSLTIPLTNPHYFPEKV